MNVITKRSQIMSARDNWFHQYRGEPDDRVTGWNRKITFGEARRRLAALDLTTCSSDDLSNAMGQRIGGGWGTNRCDECAADCEVLIRLGDEPDYEVRLQGLCQSCLEAAAKLVAVHPASAPGADPVCLAVTFPDATIPQHTPKDETDDR